MTLTLRAQRAGVTLMFVGLSACGPSDFKELSVGEKKTSVDGTVPAVEETVPTANEKVPTVDVKETSEYPEACLPSVPPEVVKANLERATAANDARLAAVESERARLGASAVKLFKVISGGTAGDEDPFPEAVPLYLDAKSEANARGVKYDQFHGYEGALTVYETRPGSKQYFIVDEVAGDGAGSVVIKNTAVQGQNEGSMHSWHTTSDNQLVRLTVHQKFETSPSVAICGCGPNDSEFDAGLSLDADMGAIFYPLGVFLLPGSEQPKLNGDSLNVEYVDRSIEIKYIAKKGKRCVSPVC